MYLSVTILMEANKQHEHTLRELDQPQANLAPLCIAYPETEAEFELKYDLIYLLPTFHELENEDSQKHLKAFHMTCSTIKPQRVTVLFHFL